MKMNFKMYGLWGAFVGALSQNAHADISFYSGIGIGGVYTNAGYKGNNMDGKGTSGTTTYYASTKPYNINESDANFKILGEIFGGMGKKFANNFYLGSEINAGLDTTKVTAFDGTSRGYPKITAKRNFFAGLSLRPGYFVNDNTLVYARLGAELGKWSVKSDMSSSPTYVSGNQDVNQADIDQTQLKLESKKTSVSLLTGLGVDYKFSQNLFGRVEVNYAFVPSVKFIQNKNVVKAMSGIYLNNRVSLSQTSIKFGVGYLF